MKINNISGCFLSVVFLLVVTCSTLLGQPVMDKIEVEVSEEILEDSIIVKFVFKNNLSDEVFLSNDFSYSGYSLEDSILILDSEYFNMPYDWLVIPKLKLSYVKLQPGGTWEVTKSKKSKRIESYRVSFNLILPQKIKNRKALRNLKNGFLTSEQLYSRYLEDSIEIVSYKI